MRIALRLVCVLTTLGIVSGVAFYTPPGVVGGNDRLFLLDLACAVLGILLALLAVILGIAATTQRSQFAWLVTILVVANLPVVGISVVEAIGRYASPATSFVVTQNRLFAIICGGSVLSALVVFLYSIRMRDPAPLGAPQER